MIRPKLLFFCGGGAPWGGGPGVNPGGRCGGIAAGLEKRGGGPAAIPGLLPGGRAGPPVGGKGDGPPGNPRLAAGTPGWLPATLELIETPDWLAKPGRLPGTLIPGELPGMLIPGELPDMLMPGELPGMLIPGELPGGRPAAPPLGGELGSHCAP
jgi:hypothetical protein